MTSLFALRPAMRFLTEPLTPTATLPNSGSANALVGNVYSTFKDIMGEVNRLQFNAEDQSRAFAAGDVEDVHDVALAINKAKFALDLTVRVRDRLIDAYRELSNMR